MHHSIQKSKLGLKVLQCNPRLCIQYNSGAVQLEEAQTPPSLLFCIKLMPTYRGKTACMHNLEIVKWTGQLAGTAQSIPLLHLMC
jgi:hypothetical protein